MRFALLACIALILPMSGAAAQTLLPRQYDPGLGTLPSQQGWNYVSSTSTIVPSIVQGELYQPNLGAGQGQSWNRSDFTTDFNTPGGFVAQINMKLVSGDYFDFGSNWRTNYSFIALDQNQRMVTFGISSAGFILSNDSDLSFPNSTSFIPFNTTSGFHDYRLTVNSSGISLSVDNASIPAASLPLGSPVPFASHLDFGPNQGYGTSESYLKSLQWTVQGVPAASAAATDNAFVNASRPDPGHGPATTNSFANLDILDGGSYTLGPNETLNLSNGVGTLYVHQGGVFTGNGVIQGNVANAGLVRIPIVPLDSISRVSGGIIQVVLPVSPDPIAIHPPGDHPIIVQPGTLVGFTPSGSATPTSAGGGGGGGSGGFTGASIRIDGPHLEVRGELALDASLEITGSYTQTDTGALRLFIAGDVNFPGDGLHPRHETYSVLTAGEHVSLAGSLQIVLQPEMFGFVPHHGTTFDVIKSAGGITVDPSLQLLSLVTLQGSSYLAGLGLTQSPFDSGFAADPDHLYLLSPDLWRYRLINNDTILQLEFIGVPEPSTNVLLSAGAVGILLIARRRRV